MGGRHGVRSKCYGMTLKDALPQWYGPFLSPVGVYSYCSFVFPQRYLSAVVLPPPVSLLSCASPVDVSLQLVFPQWVSLFSCDPPSSASLRLCFPQWVFLFILLWSQSQPWSLARTDVPSSDSAGGGRVERVFEAHDRGGVLALGPRERRCRN